jgi:aspartokinase-like uncharacterized kinase
MSRLPLRVVKVGGSLLARGDLRSRLKAWLARQPAAIHVLVAGGGELADVIREWDQLHGLGEEQCHWQCIRLLSVTSSVLAALIGDSAPILDLPQLQQRIAQARADWQPVDLEAPPAGHRLSFVFDLQDFLAHHEPQLPHPAPHTWSVTTDSLAARLAEILEADELILLKSVPLSDPSLTLTELAAANYVDSYFPNIALRLPKVNFATLDD